MGEQPLGDDARPAAQPSAATPGPGRLVVLAGPTAVGKGTVSRFVRDHYPDIVLSVSATTRPPRPDETEGVAYHFVSDAEFDRMISAGELLEWATVHGRARYGTPRAPVERALAAGRPVLLEIDVQGARQVRERMPDAVLVFLAPPTWDELLRRGKIRGTEDVAERERRLITAKAEMAAASAFDVTIVNDEVRRAAQDLVALIRSPDSAPGASVRRQA